jgi:hypothetical protein
VQADYTDKRGFRLNTMFNPTIDGIKQLAEKYPKRIKELEWIFDKPTNIYIDFANVIRWQGKVMSYTSCKNDSKSVSLQRGICV